MQTLLCASPAGGFGIYFVNSMPVGRKDKIMQKILVIGCSGSGKSTLAKQLGQKLHIEVIHLDSLYWNAGWVSTPKAEWREKVECLCQGEQWIQDGNYGSTLQMRLQYADTVILFDYPRLQCLWGAVKRRFMYSGKTRPDMAVGCPEKIDVEFLQWIWNFNKNEKPHVLQLLSEYKGQIYVLKNHKDAKILTSKINISENKTTNEVFFDDKARH